MSDLNLRSDNVDVDAIMRQIRQRIKEKRGVDYTEAEVRELASVKLERFLDPRAVRSDLVQHYRRLRPPAPLAALHPKPETYPFEDETIYESHRAPLLRTLRRLLNPILKLFFNPNPLIRVLHLQSKINEYLLQDFEFIRRKFQTRDELDGLNYEVTSNLVLELTKLGIEVKNLRMRLESLSARLDFDERRARALEGVVQYRPEAFKSPEPERDRGEEEQAEGEGGQRSAKRRRRRRGRRRTATGPEESAAGMAGAGSPDAEAGSAETAADEPREPAGTQDHVPERTSPESDEP